MDLGEEYMNAVRNSKGNIMKCGSNHNNSIGYYYSFGNTWIFDKANTSSVGQYVRKMAGQKSDINNTVIEEMTSAGLHAEIKNTGKILLVLPSVIAPIFNVAHYLQSNDGDIDLVETNISGLGI